MKLNFLFILLIFLITNCNSTNTTDTDYKIEGIISSNKTNKPVTGVAVKLNNLLVDSSRANGYYSFEGLDDGYYNLSYSFDEHHRNKTIDSILIDGDNLNLDIQLDFKYNLIYDIVDVQGIESPESLLGNYLKESTPIYMTNTSIITFDFEDYVSVDDTLKIAFSHKSDTPVYYQFLRLSFTNTSSDEIVSLIGNNDNRVREIKFLPKSFVSDSSKRMTLSVQTDNSSQIRDLAIYYILSF